MLSAFGLFRKKKTETKLPEEAKPETKPSDQSEQQHEFESSEEESSSPRTTPIITEESKKESFLTSRASLTSKAFSLSSSIQKVTEPKAELNASKDINERAMSRPSLASQVQLLDKLDNVKVANPIKVDFDYSN